MGERGGGGGEEAGGGGEREEVEAGVEGGREVRRVGLFL